MENEKEKNKEEGLKILIESLENAHETIFDLRTSKIVLLKELLERDRKIQTLTKIIADLKFPKEK